MNDFIQLERSEIRFDGPLLFRPPVKSESEGESQLGIMMNRLQPMLKKEEAGLRELKQSWLIPSMSTFLARGNCNNGELPDFLGTLSDLFDSEEGEGEENERSETLEDSDYGGLLDYVFPRGEFPKAMENRESPGFRPPSIDEETVSEPLPKAAAAAAAADTANVDSAAALAEDFPPYVDSSDLYMNKMKCGWFVNHFSDIQ